MKKLKKAMKLLEEQGLEAFLKTLSKYLKPRLCRVDLILRGLWIREFHRIYYSDVLRGTYWFGTKVLQCPLDMWMLQEIVYETKPDFVIETGTSEGGSTYFFAHILDLIGKGAGAFSIVCAI